MRSEHPESDLGYLCRCEKCGREERAGSNPLRNGWPECCGYTMTLVDTKRFIAAFDSEVSACVTGLPANVGFHVAGVDHGV